MTTHLVFSGGPPHDRDYEHRSLCMRCPIAGNYRPESLQITYDTSRPLYFRKSLQGRSLVLTEPVGACIQSPQFVHVLDVIQQKFRIEELYIAPFAQTVPTIRNLRVTAPVLDSSAFLAHHIPQPCRIRLQRPFTHCDRRTSQPRPPGTVIRRNFLHLLNFADAGLPPLKWAV